MGRLAPGWQRGNPQADDNHYPTSDLGKDIEAGHDGEEHYGFETWFSGHRNGETGINNPGTADINAYIDAIEWIQQQIESDAKPLCQGAKRELPLISQPMWAQMDVKMGR
ncbi:hypothetical protein BBP40_011167 [Aspergillus hancockii]|nr:hypothetical protein BBP40_011167 [Aspergillus hancockii]